MKYYYALLLLCFLLCLGAAAQTGISVSPPRVYFETDPGQSSTERVVVTNVSAKHTLDLAVSLGDWAYSRSGENMMYPADSLPASCAGWVTLKKEDTYFSLKPGERKEIGVNITVPQTAKDSAHTAMLYVTQMNPVDDIDQKGANIKVSIRSGIKLFQKTRAAVRKKIEITNLHFNKSGKTLTVSFENTGVIWADGILYTDLVNTRTGKKTTAEHIVFYSMPGDQRDIEVALPKELPAGAYTASVIIDYGNKDQLEMAELTFTNE